MFLKRSSGILLHPSSLPGPYGIGTLGPSAYRWIEVLKDMQQQLWQVLPLGPTGYGDSPYQCFSSFAGNTNLISLELLEQEALLSKADLESLLGLDDDQVNFGKLIPIKNNLLDRAAGVFLSRADSEALSEFDNFCEHNSEWLDDYVLFRAIKSSLDEKPWWLWPSELKLRDKAALNLMQEKHREQCERLKVQQFLFDKQWSDLKKQANAAGIQIIGDIPIFVAHDSSEVWVQPGLFLTDEEGDLTHVAGVPPDYFSETGQRWGNPLYDWDKHEEQGFSWWFKRIEKTLELVDIFRIDHFIGLENFWKIPASEETAVNGEWTKAKGRELLIAMQAKFGNNLPVVAEVLGVVTDQVRQLVNDFELPDIRIFQFAFGADGQAPEFLPDNYPENCVAYTGSHDNETMVAWFNKEPGIGNCSTQEQIEAERRCILEYLGTDGAEIHWDSISAVMQSKAAMAVTPLQDLLGLGTEARMNVPGVLGGNWQWRFTWRQLQDSCIAKMAGLVQETKRSSSLA